MSCFVKRTRRPTIHHKYRYMKGYKDAEICPNSGIKTRKTGSNNNGDRPRVNLDFDWDGEFKALEELIKAKTHQHNTPTKTRKKGRKNGEKERKYTPTEDKMGFKIFI